MKRHLLPAVQERLGVSRRTVLNWIASGQLAAIDVSSTPGSKRPRYVVDEADLAAFETRRRTAGAVPVQRQRRVRSEVPNYFANLGRG